MNKREKLWQYMDQEHDVQLLDSDCNEIEHIFKSQWISVEDRLPELRQVVDCWTPANRGYRIANVTYEGDVWRELDFDASYTNKLITHWMPLPEPPVTPCNPL